MKISNRLFEFCVRRPPGSKLYFGLAILPIRPIRMEAMRSYTMTAEGESEEYDIVISGRGFLYPDGAANA